jgi:DNA-binding PadR family transcriptional regulator
MQKEVVKRFLDVVILCVLRKNGNLNGNEIRLLINEKLGIFLRPGSVYSTLYALERENLVKGLRNYRFRTYCLTPKGLTRSRDVGEIVKTFNLLMMQLCGDEAQ